MDARNGMRTLRSGRSIKETARTMMLPVTTRCPETPRNAAIRPRSNLFSVSLDLETGDIWMGSDDGWKRASRQISREALKVRIAK